jgi:hypothetical protein
MAIHMPIGAVVRPEHDVLHLGGDRGLKPVHFFFEKGCPSLWDTPFRICVHWSVHGAVIWSQMLDCGKTMAKRVNLQVAKFPLREL